MVSLVVLLSGLATEAAIIFWIRQHWVLERRQKFVVKSAGWLLVAFLLGAFMLEYRGFNQLFPRAVARTWDSLSIAWVLLTVPGVLLMGLLKLGSQVVTRIWPRHEEARRKFLRVVPAVAWATPPAVIGYGVYIARNVLRLREERIKLRDLPPELDGLKIAQLTDIHLGEFVSLRQLEVAVAMANEARPRIALVTGDLITTEQDPLDECLKALRLLRADAGVFGCMGNHEVYAGVQDYVEREGARGGIKFLRDEAQQLRFGKTILNLAGVDYQNWRRPYLSGAEKLTVASAFNVLLSHNPDVFPMAVRKGFPLTFAGHTHGGQVRVEILNRDLNMARFFTPYVDGVYRDGSSAIFVSRGIGTIGVPVRLGAPPELALIELCRA